MIPNRKISAKALLTGSLVALLCFHGVAGINLFLTKRTFADSSMTNLYGSIPLLFVVFFIWLRLLWYVVLLGACVCLAAEEEWHPMQKENRHFAVPFHDTLLMAGIVEAAAHDFAACLIEFVERRNTFTCTHHAGLTLLQTQGLVTLNNSLGGKLAGGLDSDKIKVTLIPATHTWPLLFSPEHFVRALFAGVHVGTAETGSTGWQHLKTLAELAPKGALSSEKSHHSAPLANPPTPSEFAALTKAAWQALLPPVN
jgi:hypothetical protein